MARESTITFEQVSAAADHLKSQGVKPTARNVRDALGSGSMATVLKFLQQWQAGQMRQSQVIDDTLDPAIARAISNQIANTVQEATAAATARLADLQAEADSIIVENERQAAELEHQAANMAALQEQLAVTTGRAQQIEADAGKLAAELAAERIAAETVRVELAKAELRLEAVPRIEGEIEKVRAELLQSRNLAAELHEAAAVATAKLEAETLQRKSIESQLVDMMGQREEALNRAVASSEALSEERVAVRVVQARLDDAMRELEALKRASTSAQEEITSLRSKLDLAKKKGE